MERLIKYCCLFVFLVGVTGVGYAAEPATPATKCPAGQVFDKDVKACIQKVPVKQTNENKINEANSSK